MKQIATLVRQAQHLGLRTTAEKAVGLAWRGARYGMNRTRDRYRSSYVSTDELRSLECHHLKRHLPALALPATFPVEQYRDLAEQYLQHRFDLLGSGWVEVCHGAQCQGTGGNRYESGPSVSADVAGAWLLPRINRSNLPQAIATWQQIAQPYTPIDWQLDFKSGYRWSEQTWYGSVPYGHRRGVDIKVPWELARMQHLPQMAVAYAAARQIDGDEVKAARLAREFRNQLLDFIATNPPRFGVNWRCPMDVGIRAANWVLAFDLFCAAGWQADEPFESRLITSLLAHGRYILKNLEWRRVHRGNHYLANIAGLFFIASYLPRSRETISWLTFSMRELARETLLQFTPDGANFEASTSYHRLSAEMVIYCAAWIQAQTTDDDRSQTTTLTAEHWRRIGNMAEFSRDLTKPNGNVHQIGDNDNGRFFKLHPILHDTTFTENHLDHRPLVSAIGTLLGQQDLVNHAGSHWADTLILQHLLQNRPAPPNCNPPRHEVPAVVSYATHNSPRRLIAELSKQPQLVGRQFEIRVPVEVLRQPLTTIAYRDFGVYLWRNDRLYLAVRCGPIGQQDNGGHAHNDQLTIELQVDGEDWLVDPGTFVYTALPDARNAYRSVAAHFAPRLVEHREPGRLDMGLFQLGNDARAKLLAFDATGFVGMHHGYGLPVYRTLLWRQNRIIVQDYSDRSQPLLPVQTLDCRPAYWATLPMSTGYGIQRAA